MASAKYGPFNRNVGKPNEHQVGGLERDPGDQILGIDLPHQRDDAAHQAAVAAQGAVGQLLIAQRSSPGSAPRASWC